MKVAIYRNDLYRGKYHLHLEGPCGGNSPSESRVGEVEMPEAVYKVLTDRFSSRGYALVPDDIAGSELASDWWSVVFMLVR